MKRVTFERRLAALEERIGGGSPVILRMRDGSVHQVPGGGKHFLKLCTLLGSDQENHPLSSELRLIRESVSANDEMFTLLRILLAGPCEEQESEEILGLLKQKRGRMIR